MAEIIYKLGSPLIKAHVVKRPSAICKSPYVADVICGPTGANDTTSELAHSPSLGCSGHVETGSSVMMEKKCGNGKCLYSIDFSIFNEVEKDNTQLICVNPKHSDKVVREMLRPKPFISIKPTTVKA